MSIETGKKDAQDFIQKEQIDYAPFVALSDMHMVRKTIPVSYTALQTTIEKLDSDLWLEIDGSAQALATKHGQAFDLDGYAAGFVEGVDAVWEKIRDEVLKS